MSPPFSAARASAPGITDEQRAISELAYELGARYTDRRFDDHSASLAQWNDLRESGLTALSLPEEYGGVGGMFDLCLASERLAAGGFPAAKLVIATSIAGSILARNGTEAQRQRWLPSMVTGETCFCFAFTEPEAGSNANRIRTTSERKDGHWVIRGEKTYISALESSNAMLVVTKDVESGGLSLFALDFPTEQITSSRVQVETPVFEHQWNVFFDQLELPDEALIGEPGHGGAPLFDGLNPERLVIAAQAVGVGRWCLERAARYASERVVFDVPIGTHQGVQHPLAEALVAVEAAAGLADRAARLYDEGHQAGLESNMAKIAACDAGLLAADRGLQVFGGSGFTDESMMLQRFTYMRLLRSIPVARELALNHIATSGLGLPRSY